jgi:hypothetical protein
MLNCIPRKTARPLSISDQYPSVCHIVPDVCAK